MDKQAFKDNFFSRNFSLNLGGRLMDLSRPRVMGILNLSPDSFYNGGRYISAGDIKERIGSMISDGADIIDVGAVSTRPGAREISESEEIKRLESTLKLIRSDHPDFPLSLDTSNPAVAEMMIRDYNIHMINDITAGGESEKMFEVISKYQVPYIIMHMQGVPLTMQEKPEYKDVVDEILVFFGKKISRLTTLGVNDIIVDPGFGFGKDLTHNYQLMTFLDCFQALELPIMIGISRKSMICRLLSLNPEDALNGTTALHMYALMKGANILRVHDVKEAKQVCRIYSETESHLRKALFS